MVHEVKLDGITVTWWGHASFLIDSGRKIYIDPFVLPDNPEPADIILVTHEHFDHCDTDNVNKLRKDGTKIIASQGSVSKIGDGEAARAGDKVDIPDFAVEAVEAYNVNKFRSPGNPFHPRGLGVGFVVNIAGKRIYHAGDTDNIEEMKNLKDIDLALLPAGGTYTMTIQEAAQAAETIKPKFLVPMHYNSDKYGVAGINANPVELAKALVGKGIVVNILDPVV